MNRQGSTPGCCKNADSYWDKINARLNTEYTFNKYVKMGFDIAPRVESWDDTPDLFSAAMSMDPTTPIFKLLKIFWSCMKLSLMIRHEAETEGKMAYLFPLGKREEPSARIEAVR